METPTTKQSEQERVSSQAKKPKDEKQKTERRSFLKAAGVSALGLGQVADFLDEFTQDGWMFNSAMKDYLLSNLKSLAKYQALRQELEQAKQKEREYRDSLTGQAKVDYFVEKLRTEDIGLYRAGFQRGFLELIRDDKPIPQEEHYIFKAKTINERFEGCSKSFRRKAIDQYLAKVLPEMESKQREEDAEQEAYDDLLNYLANNKTVEEVVTLTKQLKRTDAA